MSESTHIQHIYTTMLLTKSEKKAYSHTMDCVNTAMLLATFTTYTNLSEDRSMKRRGSKVRKSLKNAFPFEDGVVCGSMESSVRFPLDRYTKHFPFPFFTLFSHLLKKR
jgi:hypothetical protein